ncbi:MAG: hypothetical protein QOI20_1887 [Acidimicrobiaceae bacterium]|jgi:prevent-host-death family protein|nr:hypothetical protein [Acidimicrobiaceae bacterium]
MDQIGVRELRQNASTYLARVAGGESIEVTDRGRPVALLVPVPVDRWEALVESGRVSAPTDDADLLMEGPSDYGVNGSAALQALREDAE